MFVQALLALIILLTFNKVSILIAISSIILVAIYPLSKRFTWWPQFFLGLTFNWGVLVGYSAIKEYISLTAFILYLAGVSWTLFYDTIYALQDLKDDTTIGVKSTARLFGEDTKFWLVIFLLMFCLLTSIAVLTSNADRGIARITVIILGISFLLAHLVIQVTRLDTKSSQSSMKTFRSNRDAGLLLVLTLFAICFI